MARGSAHTVLAEKSAAPARTARLSYVQAARGVAILGVILIHVADMLHFPPGTVGAEFQPALEGVSGMFVVIAGFLFQHLSGRFAYGAYLRRKLTFVFLPYLLFSLPAIAIYVLDLKAHPWLADAFLHDNPFWLVAGYFILTGQHLGPLWFMPMIALFYLAAPIFLWIDRHPKAYWIIPILLVVSTVVTRPVHNENPFQSFVHFLPLYLIGMAASRWKHIVMPALTRRAGLVLGLAALGVAISVATHPPYAIHTHLKIPLAFAAFALFARAPALAEGPLDSLGEISFGLYFVHAFLVSFGRLVLSTMDPPFTPTLPALAVMYLIVALVAFGTVQLLRAVLGARSRYMIGA